MLRLTRNRTAFESDSVGDVVRARLTSAHLVVGYGPSWGIDTITRGRLLKGEQVPVEDFDAYLTITKKYGVVGPCTDHYIWYEIGLAGPEKNEAESHAKDILRAEALMAEQEFLAEIERLGGVLEAAQFAMSPEGRKADSGAMGELRKAVEAYNEAGECDCHSFPCSCPEHGNFRGYYYCPIHRGRYIADGEGYAKACPLCEAQGK